MKKDWRILMAQKNQNQNSTQETHKNSMKNSIFSFQNLQSLGQSLMLPVSVLPGAGLIVALGRYLQIKNPLIGNLLYHSGIAIFEQLPLIFAIGVAIGFSGGAGVAGLSAAAAYFTLINLLKVMSETRHLTLAINTGVFGGIIIGLLATWTYKRFHETRLHPVLGFFSGKRLVPILSIFGSVGIGLFLSFVWPPIQDSINHFGSMMTQSSLGPAFYAAGKRLLIPVGLHHVYYPSFLFEFGQFINAAGEMIKGDSPRYFAGDPSAGLFMASEYPIMLFGLPAAALAMVFRASSKNKKAVAGIMLSAALTSIVTGITEPIEFSFIFVAPLLYLVHVGLAFLSGLLTQMFDVHLGYTFSASLIDYVLGFFNQKNSLQLWIFIGPIVGLLYFSTFYYLIPLFQFKTPGREDDAEPTTIYTPELHSVAIHRIESIVKAIGGIQNIISIDACITRLRLHLNNTSLLQETQLKSLGASGVLKTNSGSAQIVFGTESEFIKDEIKKYMLGHHNNNSSQFKKFSGRDLNIQNKDVSNGFQIYSPITGKLIPLNEIPDDTFAKGLMGPGIGILPANNTVVAPFDGKIVTLFHTHHALGLESQDLIQGNKIELLIHIGIDTVQLKGLGFKPLVQQGDFVKKGQVLIEFDPDLIIKNGKSLITPVIITNADNFNNLRFMDKDRKSVEALETIATISNQTNFNKPLIETENKNSNLEN